ncbi:hypothetical protein ARMGADRAFT_951366, partial [Armillaria gallica]
MQVQLSRCQLRWMDYMFRFNFDITYVKGENNKVADCLSRYYENDNTDDMHHAHEYVCADVCVNPEELWDIEARELAEARSEGCTDSIEGMDDDHEGDDVTISDMLATGPDGLNEDIEDDEFLTAVKEGYSGDRLFKVILAAPQDHTLFAVHDGMIWT